MSDALVLDCGEQMTIAQVNQLHSQMMEILNGEQDVQCQVDNIQRCDTAGVQLLLSFHNNLKAMERKCTFSSLNEQLVEVAGYLGLDGFLKNNL